MSTVATLDFNAARACVLSKVRSARGVIPVERVPLKFASGRVLAEAVFADRDYPPASRSVRDGFAVRAADTPGELNIVGEIRAGQRFEGRLEPGSAIEIMTGAALPAGADAVVMVENTSTLDGRVSIPRAASVGDNFVPQGAEARSGAQILEPGVRIGFAETALLATAGRGDVQVFQRPRIAILATGDEIVGVEETPLPWQVRNSNSWSLHSQVEQAGGLPVMLPVAPDEHSITRDLIERGLQSDLLLLSGGVSAGKYDLVERVLGDLAAEFFFDRVRIQPGQPLVFGTARGKFFFGLPGNPASTMVTFAVFARAAVELLGGVSEPLLPLLRAPLACEFHQKTGLTRFLPARLEHDGSRVTPIAWRGSGDVAAMARSNVWIVTDSDRESWAEGDLIRVLAK